MMGKKSVERVTDLVSAVAPGTLRDQWSLRERQTPSELGPAAGRTPACDSQTLHSAIQ